MLKKIAMYLLPNFNSHQNFATLYSVYTKRASEMA